MHVISLDGFRCQWPDSEEAGSSERNEWSVCGAALTEV